MVFNPRYSNPPSHIAHIARLNQSQHASAMPPPLPHSYISPEGSKTKIVKSYWLMLDIQNTKSDKISENRPKGLHRKKKLSTFAAPKRMRLPEAEVSP